MNVAKGKPTLEKSIIRPEELTNGITDGYDGHNGFAYFKWPGYCTVDLDAVRELKSIRMLLWDRQGKGQVVPADRVYKYRLLTSNDCEQWQVIYESDDVGTIGWQVFEFDKPHSAHYIRVHGLWCSKQPTFHLVELEAHDSPAPLPQRPPKVHLRLGATATYSNEATSYKATGTIREIIRQLRELPDTHPSINPVPLQHAADALEQKLDDITRLEESIEAVNRRIVEPVAKELEFGRRAGRFSVGGFWVGMAGIILSVILFALSIWLQSN